MSPIPPSGAPRPVSTPPSQAAPEIPPASTGGASLAALWLQSEAYRQLVDLTAQQAAAKMKAQMQASARTAPASAVGDSIWSHQSLVDLNQGIGGLSDFFAQARLLSLAGLPVSPDRPDDKTLEAELNALGTSLSQFLDGIGKLGSLTQNGVKLSDLQSNLLDALKALPHSFILGADVGPVSLAMILYTVLYHGNTSASPETFRADLTALRDSGKPLAPLASLVLAGFSPPSQLPTPKDGHWSSNNLIALTDSLGTWFQSPSKGSGGFWSAAQVAGLEASLLPWIQVLGQNGNAAANTDIGCLRTVAMAMAIGPELGADPTSFDGAYQAGSGILSLGFFMNIEMASYLYQSVLQAGGSEDSLSKQMKSLVEASGPSSQMWADEINAINETIRNMSGSNPIDKPLDHPSDSLAAPLMALWFGGVPKQLTQSEALAEAMALFSPERIRSLSSQLIQEGASTEVESQIREQRLQETRHKETRG